MRRYSNLTTLKIRSLAAATDNGLHLKPCVLREAGRILQ